MPATTAIRYIGSKRQFFETELTGRPQSWRVGQTAEVLDSDVSAYLGSGLFERVLPDAGAPVTASVTLSGDVLTCSISALIAAGYTGTPSYQWRRSASSVDLSYQNAQVIAGATAASYTRGAQDEGRKLWVTVSGLVPPAVDAGVVPAAVVVGVSPGVSANPVITSTPRVGDALSAQTYNSGSYTGTPAPVTSLVGWLLDGSLLSAGYSFVSGDVGKSLQVREQASNASGTVTATSTAVALAAQEAVAPSTITQEWSAMSAGAPGPVNLTNNAARVYFQHNGITLVWTGLITGTSATLVANNDFSNLPNAIQVSVDGGAFTAAPNTGSTYTLFSGAQATRLVTVVVNNGMAQSVYVARTGTVISVTGEPPSIVTPATWVDPLGSSALTAWTASKTALAGTGWTTTYLTASSSDAQSATTSGSNVPSIRLRTASASLWIYSRFRYAYVGVDDSITPTRYDSGLADGPGRIHRITGLTGAHTYNVWSGSASQGASAMQPFFVGVDSAGLVDVGTKARMVQYGDSISAGRDGTTRGECELFAVAASMGYVGSTAAVSGNTIANLRARIDYDLANRTTDPLTDVAIVAIGRNNVSGMVAQDRTDMQYILSALKAKYKKVLVRGVLRAGDGVTTFPTINADLQAEVAAAADAKIVYVQCDDVPAYATTDSTHPTDAGYVTLRAPIRAKYVVALA